MSRQKTLLIAHRGNSEHFIENSIEAFVSAVEEGADLIEMNLQLSSDDQVFVFHDFSLERLCSKTVRADSLSMNELSELQLTLNNKKSAHIPSLKSVLNLLGNKVRLYLELKSCDDAQQNERLLTKTVELLGSDTHHLVASFDTDLVSSALKRNSPTAMICNDIEELGALTSQEISKLQAISIRHTSIDATTLKHCNNIPLWCWTIDKEEDADTALNNGVTAICSNDVPRMFRHLSKAS